LLQTVTVIVEVLLTFRMSRQKTLSVENSENQTI
jgi:hypothetical protein